MPPNGFPDGTPGPATEPIHTYHLGLWFNSPQDAQKAGGPGTVTRFNGEHNAGVQVLGKNPTPNTRKRANTVFKITAAIVISIGVRESLRERNIAVITALVTVTGIAAANN